VRYRLWKALRWARRPAVWLLAVGLAVGVGYLGYQNWPPLTTCPAMSGDHLVITFGTGREPLSRAITVPFAPTGTGASAAAQGVPQGLAVRLNGDLRLLGEQGEMPTAQVTVGSTRVSERRVTVTATADPSQPEQVATGCYSGDIVVESATGAVQRIPLLVDLGTRSGWRAAVAFGVLLVGAFTGLAIKWITESLTPLGTQRKRLDSLRRALRLSEEETDVLPTDADIKLDDIEDRIRRGDLQGIEDEFKEVEDHKALLRRISALLSRLNRILLRQEDATRPAGPAWLPRRGEDERRQRDIATIIDRERRELAGVRDLAWPSKRATILKECDKLEQWFQTATLFIPKYLRNPDNPILRQVRDLYHASNFQAAEDLFLAREQSPTAPGPGPSPAPAPAPPPAPAQLSPEQELLEPVESKFVLEPPLTRPPPRPFSVVDWAARKARPFAAIASVIIVALVGLKLQYLEVPGFQNHVGDWLTLFLWATVIELSGVSVLDVIGRLGSSGVPTTTR